MWGSQKTIQCALNPLYPNKKVQHKKTKTYKPKSLEWKNAAIEVENKRERKKNSYHFTHPAQDSINSHPYLNQNKKLGTKEKKDSTPVERKLIKNYK